MNSVWFGATLVGTPDTDALTEDRYHLPKSSEEAIRVQHKWWWSSSFFCIRLRGNYGPTQSYRHCRSLSCNS